jgi:Dolichyl-phosphate-mannose-protein mannosyltransferase
MFGAVGAAVARRIDVSYARRPQFAFPLLALCVLGFYALLRAPVLNSENYLDPWIYTAAFTNFGAMYRLFGSTYYVSRLPWLIPGIAVHSIFPPLVGFFVLHVLFYVAASGFAYLLFRHFYGRTVALAACAALMLSPLFYDSYSNDYPDGAVLTYLFGAAYFGLTAASSPRRTLRLVLAGFFAAAAVGTNLFSVVVVGGLAIVFLAVTSGQAGWVARLARDSAAALAGGVALLCLCGTFSEAYGGPFLFFMPQWRFARSVDTSAWKLHGYGWLRHESQLLVPLIALAFFAAALIARRAQLRYRLSEPRVRLVLGSGLMLLYFVSVIAIWEFAFTGDFLELEYYFTLFNIPVALAMAGTLQLLGLEKRPAFPVAAAVVMSGLPLLLVYGIRAAPTGSAGARVTVVLLTAVAIVFAFLALFARRRPRVGAAVAAAAGLTLVFLPNFAAASGGRTAIVFQNGGETFAQRRATLTMALQLIDFVRGHGLQRTVPNFWYDDRGVPVLDAVQSTYLWGTTSIGRQMPKTDASLRETLKSRRPESLILLASSPAGAAAGAAAIRRLSYHLKPVATSELHAGHWRFGVYAFRVAEFYGGDAFSRYYGSLDAELEQPPARVAARWRFAHGAPSGWEVTPSLRSRPIAGGTRFVTSTTQGEYELIAPRRTLSAGTYALYLRGRVARGGIDFGFLDAGTGQWLSQATYWFRQRLARGWMVVHLSLAHPTDVQVVLSNWVPPDSSSTWDLHEVRLARIGP